MDAEGRTLLTGKKILLIGICDDWVFEENFNFFRLRLDHRHVDCGRTQFGFGSYGCHRSHGMFQVGIQPFIRVQLGGVTEEIGNLNLFAMLCQPITVRCSLSRMHSLAAARILVRLV
jgi:hypothetical protein